MRQPAVRSSRSPTPTTTSTSSPFPRTTGCPRRVHVHGRDSAAGAGDDRYGDLVGGVAFAVDRERRDVDEVAGDGVQVVVAALELQPQYAGDDVQTRLVEVVMMPAGDGAGRGLDPSGLQLRQFERPLPQHPGRR